MAHETAAVSRVLVTGWFSFDDAEITAGDLLARDAAVAWLDDAGHAHDVAMGGSYAADGVDWRAVDPGRYSHLLFVCGPAAGERVDALLRRFAGCRRVGFNVSVPDADAGRHGFDEVLARDGAGAARPDASILPATRRVPVVGVVLAHAQPEYAERGRHDRAHAAIEAVLRRSDVARVPFDTRVDTHGLALATPDHVESLLARTDAVVTTRLHGMVLALKNGVPALAVDPVAGGAKVADQAAALGWPVVFTADDLDQDRLAGALRFCLGAAARRAAQDCMDRAAGTLEEMRSRFVALLEPA